MAGGQLCHSSRLVRSLIAALYQVRGDGELEQMEQRHHQQRTDDQAVVQPGGGQQTVLVGGRQQLDWQADRGGAAHPQDDFLRAHAQSRQRYQEGPQRLVAAGERQVVADLAIELQALVDEHPDLHVVEVGVVQPQVIALAGAALQTQAEPPGAVAPAQRGNALQIVAIGEQAGTSLVQRQLLGGVFQQAHAGHRIDIGVAQVEQWQLRSRGAAKQQQAQQGQEPAEDRQHRHDLGTGGKMLAKGLLPA
jgi:hypothetical protein